jgi:phenylacetate-CoA ligase
LNESQWFSPSKIEAFQLTRLRALLEWTGQPQSWLTNDSLASALKGLPILTREQLQARPVGSIDARLPPGHKAAGIRSSSGSTGRPVAITTTDFALGWQNALNLRAHIWAGRDFSRTIASIRHNPDGIADYPDGHTMPSWDAPTVFPFRTGKSFHLNITASISQQWEWLKRVRPSYVMTFPSILREFAALARAEREVPDWLQGLSSLGETLDAEVREELKTALGVPTHDVYSAEETGVIAIQCPETRRYHVQAESVIVEVLDELDRPCKPGEIGRVVVTPLHNYATALLRYEIGDYAEAATPCSCGRGLPTLARIVGRQRNTIRLPNGELHWPNFGRKRLSSIAPVWQIQFRQIESTIIEARVVAEGRLAPDQIDALAAAVARRLPQGLEVRISVVDKIDRGSGGKFEEFIREIA